MTAPNLTIAGLRAAPGELAMGHLTVGYYPDSSPVQIPVLAMHGAAPGPMLLLTAGMHAAEVPGIEVIRRLMREVLKPSELRGTVIAAPVLNPWGLHQHQMNTPQDGYNINRVFPGNARQLTTHRLADVIYRELVAQADFLIDFHANPLPALQFTIVKQGPQPAVFEQARQMAAAYGITTVEMILAHEGHRGGSMVEAAAADGKPGITVELVSWRRIEADAADSGVRGALNVMRHLGMLHGGIEAQTVPVLPRGLHLTRTEVTCDRGGIVHPVKTVGERVEAGEVIALIRNMFGDVVEEVRSPRTGWILAWPWILNQALATGDVVTFIAFEV